MHKNARPKEKGKKKKNQQCKAIEAENTAS